MAPTVATSGTHSHTFWFSSTLPAPYYVVNLLKVFQVPHLNELLFFLLSL